MALIRNYLYLFLAFAVCAQGALAAVGFRSSSSSSVILPAASYVTTGTATIAASGNITPPVGAERNAVLVCVVTQHDNVAISFPAGWKQLYSLSQSSTLRASAYYKVSGDTESAPTITHPGGDVIVSRCFRVRGVDGQNPFDVAYAPQYSASSATVRTGSLTTLTAGDLMLLMTHLSRSAAVSVAPASANGVTWNNVRFFTATTTGSDATVALYTGLQTAAAATGPFSYTLSAAGESYGTLVPLHNGSTLSIALPTGTVANDVMIAAITVAPQTATITPPAGWTSITSTNGSKTRLITYYKVATSSEPALYTWAVSTNHTGIAGGISSFTGVNTTNPVENSGAQTTLSSVSHTAPSVNTVTGNDGLVTVHSFASSPYSTNNSYLGAWSSPSGMAEMVDERSRGASSSSGVALEMNYLALPSSGASGVRTATASASADVGITASIALRSTNSIDHLEIDYPQATLSSCAATPVTVYACASTGTSCSTLYTGGVSGIVLTPGGGTLSIPAGSASVSGTVTQAAGAGTLAASSSAPYVATCKNLSTGAYGCGVTFAATALTISIPDFVAGKSVATTATACTVPNGWNAVNFYSSYVDPSSGTLPVSVASVAPLTGGVCGAYTAVSGSSASPKTVNLYFSSNVAPLCISYPDVGRVKLNSTLSGAFATSFFTAVPDHFVVSSVSCVSGCKVTPNPGATDASGAAFMKAGSPFSVTVSAYNGAATPAITPNFGKESVPAQVLLVPQLAMADLAGAAVGNLTCNTASASCANGVGGDVVLGGFGASTAGVATNSLLYDEAGIMTLKPSLYDVGGLGYLSIGSAALDAVGSTSGTIGRFIPDHFALVKDGTYPLLTQTDFLPKVTAAATGTNAPTSTIDVDDSTGFVVGAKIRVTGGGAGGNAFTAKITGLTATTLALDASITSDLSSGDTVVQEWGSYMGEPFSAQFSLIAQDSNNNQTQNYQGAYAKLDPTVYASKPATGPLKFAAVSGATNLTSRIAPVSSAPVTGSFTASGASIVAPLSISANNTADGPYAALTIGIAPTDSDGVAMGTFDLSVAGTVDHTSIMDPAVQANTELRYGRTKISNAYGSELLALLVPVAIQFWNGTGFVTSADDAATSLIATNILLSAPLGVLGAAAGTSPGGTCQPTPLPSVLTLTNGAGKFCLLRPGVSGSITLSANAPSYLPSANGIAKFGVYKSPLIYRRENY